MNIIEERGSNLKSINNEHDVGYKFLLSSKQVFIQLLRSFVNEEWVDSIEESQLKKIDKSYVLQDFSEKESDLVYELKIKDQEVIFYVLLELQSKVDYQMPFRLLAYMMEIWRDILKNSPKNESKRKLFRFPVIFPIVLYNGPHPWTAPLEFKNILNGTLLFGEKVLNFKYSLIDVNRYQSHELLQLSNLISSVFLLDQDMKKVEELFMRLKELTNTLNQLSPRELALFKTWLKGIVMKRFPKKNHKEIEEVINQTKTKEVGIMISNFEKNLERFIDESIEKGMKKGMERGLEKGIERGMEKGKEEGEKKSSLEIARRMLLKGMTTGDISELTKLTKDEVEELADRMK